MSWLNFSYVLPQFDMVGGIHLTPKKKQQQTKKKKKTCLSLFDMVVLNIFNSEINAFQVHAMDYVSLYPFSQSY